jgi:RNA polymerase sigma-70 factor (ECF subfamily)
VADAPPKDDVTHLLEELSDGNQDALGALVPLVYEQLRRLARSHMRREPRMQTLQTTALVHEAYVRLVDQRNVRWQNRAHFFAIAAQAMRRILVSRARARLADKRGGGEEKIQIDDLDIANPEPSVDLVAIDEALQRLAVLDPRQGRIVELRFFGGLTVEETADVLQLSAPTIKREWRTAKAWLRRELGQEGGSAPFRGPAK